MNPIWSLAATLRDLAGCWQRFFHQHCDARVCAAVRIAYALLVLIHWAVLYPDLDHWFTDAGVMPLEAARQIASPHALCVFWWLPSTSAVVHACFFVAVAQTVMLLVGLLPRASALGVLIWLASFQMRNIPICDSEDTLMRMLAFFLIWMPTGRCWSLSALLLAAWRRAARPDAASPCLAPGWGLRLFQLQMAVMFLSAGLEKLAGVSWVNGTAVYYVARLDDFFGRFPTPAWMFDTPWVVFLITWSVILVEVLAPLLVWFRETRLPCLAALLLFHLANEWTMHLFLFHWLMLVGWMSFLVPDDFRWLRFGARALAPGPVQPAVQ